MSEWMNIAKSYRSCQALNKAEPKLSKKSLKSIWLCLKIVYPKIQCLINVAVNHHLPMVTLNILRWLYIRTIQMAKTNVITTGRSPIFSHTTSVDRSELPRFTWSFSLIGLILVHSSQRCLPTRGTLPSGDTSWLWNPMANDYDLNIFEHWN